MTDILIICTGNTCRSPMAEGILKNLLAEKGIADFRVESAGIGAGEGMPATSFAIEVSRHWGIDISAHAARRLTMEMIERADLILVMSREHLEAVVRKNPDAIKKTFMIKAFPEPFNPSQEGVADPIGGTLDDYHQTYLELDEILRRNVNKIVQMTDIFKKGKQ